MADKNKNNKMQIAKAFVKNIDEDEGVLDAAVASVGVTDRAGDVIDQDGWKLQNFTKNPQLLWGHNQRDYRPPIGRVEKIWFEGKGEDKKLMFRPKFDLKDDFAKEIYRKYKEGFLHAFSVGFQAMEREENVFKEQELLEISAVAVPANPEALVVQRAFKDSKIKPVSWDEVYDEEEKEEKEEKQARELVKGPVAYHGWDTVDEDREWDARQAEKRLRQFAGGPDKEDIDWSKYQRGFGWYKDSDEDNFSAYKLPHHDVIEGNLKTVWRGVAAAMAALMGARGGVDMPDSDKKSVYNHLVKHYEQFDKEPPEYKYVKDESLKKLEKETKIWTESQMLLDLKGQIEHLKNLIKHEKNKKKKVNKKEFTEEELSVALKKVYQATAIALKKIKQKKGGE